MRDLEFEKGFHWPIETIDYFLSLTPKEKDEAMAAVDEELSRLEQVHGPLKSNKPMGWRERLSKQRGQRHFFRREK